MNPVKNKGKLHTRRSVRSHRESPSHRRESASTAASQPKASSKRSATSSASPSIPDRYLRSVSQPQSSRHERPLIAGATAPELASPFAKSTRSATTATEIDEVVQNHMMMPATSDDRQKWKGWCEVESEPAFFNVILNDLGTQDIKVQEVISLDEEMLAFIPKPVYGLIFLFQFKEDDPSKQEAACPDHVWFANQITSNACASIALLNIIMNVPDLDLGSNLESLKSSTADLTPALRGYEVCNNDFVRQVHNSFTRKMDMLNADLALSNEAHSSRHKKKPNSRRKKSAVEDHEPPGFHFIAFTPIQGCVWKLDGLEKQPMNLGAYENDWMDLARPLISERMQQYEGEQIQFNLLSLCRNPLLDHRRDLAANIRNLIATENALSSILPDWQMFIEQEIEVAVLRGPDSIYGMTQSVLDAAQPSPALLELLGSPTLWPAKLLKTRLQLIKDQGPLKAAILDEEAAVAEDSERARSRQHDYTSLIGRWIRLLAENKLLEGISVKQT